MNQRDATGMSTFEYHVLLALAAGPLHGYAIKDVVAAESSGTLTPRAGSAACRRYGGPLSGPPPHSR